MTKHFLLVSLSLLTVGAVFAQDFKLEPITTAAPDLPAAFASQIQTQGYRIVGAKGPWCEIWLRKTIPTGAKPADETIVLPIAQGSLLGIMRFPAQGSDRRGQAIKAGVYTLRYSNYPVDGAHQGVAPQRDFALLTPVSSDPDPNATPGFDALVQASMKGCGTPHPAVIGLEQPGNATFPSLVKEGEHDWVLAAKIGDVAVAIIVAGKAEG